MEKQDMPLVAAPGMEAMRNSLRTGCLTERIRAVERRMNFTRSRLYAACDRLKKMGILDQILGRRRKLVAEIREIEKELEAGYLSLRRLHMAATGYVIGDLKKF